MKVHHLNCATMAPRVVGRLVCHVLLCETEQGLVLVDSGVGLLDYADPGRLGPARHLLRLRADPAEAAVRQVERLGFAADDVRHIVLTHLDLDHVGGIADFPQATVHTTADEYHAAVVAPTLRERSRYRRAQWAHRPTFRTYGGAGEPWLGFGAAHALDGLDDRFALVPLPGHTRGHAAVAVRGERGWLLHAGDAAFHRSSLGGPGDRADRPSQRRAILAFERTMAADRSRLADNHARLAALSRRRDVDVTVLLAHDPVLFDRAVAASAPPLPR